MTVTAVPALEANRELVLPPGQERTLDNGLTVIAIERRSVPLVELRLGVPFARAQLDPVYVGQAAVFGQTLFAGTESMSISEIAAALQAVGGGMSAGVDADRLVCSGNGLASGLGRMLEILADVLTGAVFPDPEVETERGRLADFIKVAQSRPTHLAGVALLKRLFGTHPYALQTAEIGDVQAVTRDDLLMLKSRQVSPVGANLVIVGDIDAGEVLDLVEAKLGAWTGEPASETLPPTPPLTPGPIVLAHRAGVVQSSLRLALPAVPRTDPAHASLQLANLIFGGYFSSRWVENIREAKGYTYSPRSAVEHSLAGSHVLLSAEVANAVTAPALLETWYELGRLAMMAPTVEELEQARQFLLGSLLLGIATQAGLAGMASNYAAYGLRLDFLTQYTAQLAAVTVDDVLAAGASFLAPAKAITVVLGDADIVGDGLAALGPVERVATGEQ